MQIKTIEKNIKNKMNEWLSTIEDETLRKDVKDNLLVKGGCIASMLINEPVNDYDVYLMDMDVCKRIALYYTREKGISVFDGREKDLLITAYNEEYEEVNYEEGKLAINHNNSHAIALRTLHQDQIKLYFHGSAGLKIVEDSGNEALNYTPLYYSPNAISLSNEVQIVLRFWGTPEQIDKTFDFVHATNYFTFKDGLVRNLEAIESILTRRLKYKGSSYPLTSIIRAKKFIKRGFSISAGELLKMMFQISQLDLTDPDVLEEQLIGVDVAYFDLIITALRNKMDSDNTFKISNEYFNGLIDRIFNEDIEGQDTDN